VHHLVEELASFRRRALRAEARLRELEGPPTESVGSPVVTSERLAELEEENESLRERLHGARGRTKQILDRVHFLRQQAQGGEA
jgi:hypothetical protein